jgi:hypothetical protein
MPDRARRTAAPVQAAVFSEAPLSLSVGLEAAPELVWLPVAPELDVPEDTDEVSAGADEVSVVLAETAEEVRAEVGAEVGAWLELEVRASLMPQTFSVSNSEGMGMFQALQLSTDLPMESIRTCGSHFSAMQQKYFSRMSFSVQLQAGLSELHLLVKYSKKQPF